MVQRHVAPDLTGGIFENRALRLVLLEDEAVLGARADDEADDRHQKADDEQDAPAPGREILRRHQRLDEDHRAEAEQQPDRDREPDPGAPEGAVLRSRRLFDHPGRGGAELGAETDPLQQPEHDQQHRRDRRRCCRRSVSSPISSVLTPISTSA